MRSFRGLQSRSQLDKSEMNSLRVAGPLTLVVPVYNEAENFPLLWKEVSSKIRAEFNALVVYDFDEDSTVPVVRRLIESGEHRLRLEKNAFGSGVVGAIRTGFQQAGAGPVLVVMADLSDDLTLVDRMLAKYHQGYDIVAGSRYMPGGAILGGHWFKKLLSRCAGVSLHHLRGLPTHDATNAFKLYDRNMLHSITIQSTGGFEISLEITAKAFLAGYRIAEIPTVWRDRMNGESRFRLWHWLPKYFRWYLHAFCLATRHHHRVESIGYEGPKPFPRVSDAAED